MTSNGSFDRSLERWLEAEASPTAPLGLHAGVIDRASRARQRPAWLVAVRGAALPRTARASNPAGLRLAYLLLTAGLLLAAVVIALLSGAFRPDPGPLGGNGTIAFSAQLSPGSIDDEAHLMSPDGKTVRPIGTGHTTCPTFSADGRVLGYVTGSPHTDDAELQIAAPDGSSPRTVPGIGHAEYALSPDGTSIAWLKYLEARSQTELWLTPVSGGPPTRAVAAPADPDESFTHPVWAPDGRHIALESRRTVSTADNSRSYISGIYVFDLDTSQVRVLTSRPGTYDTRMSWSPDSRFIAYTGLPDGSPLPSFDADPPLDVFIIGADGSGDVNLTRTPVSEEGPLWSPSGDHLAYSTPDDATGSRLATLRMSGRNATGAPNVSSSSLGTWSADGSALLVVDSIFTPSGRSGTTRSWIRSIDPDFRGPPTTLLEIDRAITCAPSWQRLAP